MNFYLFYPLEKICSYIKKMESHLDSLLVKESLVPLYMDKQPDITEHMREVLIDWLFEICEVMKLSIDVMFLAVNLLDRYSAKEIIHRTKYQLIGITCMLIAVKISEDYDYNISIENLSSYTDYAYTPSEIIDMELEIVKSLDYEILVPLSIEFIHVYGGEFGASSEIINEAIFLAAITLQKYSFLKYLPFTIGLASILIAVNQLKKDSLVIDELFPGVLECMCQIEETLAIVTSPGYRYHSVLLAKIER